MKNKQEPSFRWAVFGISVAALLFVLVGAYLIVRIVDNNWADWKFPVIAAIVFLILVTIFAMFTALPEIKAEIAKEIEKEKEKQKIKENK